MGGKIGIRLRRACLHGGVIAVSIAAALAAGEVLLRNLFHAAPLLALDIYRFDDAGNLVLRPSLERRHVNRLWDVKIQTNSEGWRDEEVRAGEPPAIVALGDSFGFGWGVEQGESFFARLEPALSAEAPVELLNASVPGTGTSDQERLLPLLCERYRPRAVLLAFFVGNDFVDVQQGGAEQFLVEDGLLVRRPLEGEQPPFYLRIKEQLVRRSHVLQMLRAAQWSLMRDRAALAAGERVWDAWMREFAQVHRRNPPPRTEEAMDAALACLDRIHAAASGHGAALGLIVIPRSFQIDRGELEEMLAGLRWSEADLDLDRPQRVLREWGERSGVLVIDLLPGFRQRHQTAPDERLYYYPDSHLNRAGHAAAAEIIHEALRSHPVFAELADPS